MSKTDPSSNMSIRSIPLGELHTVGQAHLNHFDALAAPDRVVEQTNLRLGDEPSEETVLDRSRMNATPAYLQLYSSGIDPRIFLGDIVTFGLPCQGLSVPTNDMYN